MSTKGYRLTAATGLHKGDRDYQQDQVILLSHPRSKGCVMAVLADGMGGRSGGRKASDQVVMTAKQLFERYSPGLDEPAAALKQLVLEAHMVIKLTAISSEEEPHSTIATFLLDPDGSCHWAHAGDSRIYHFHDKQLIQRTLDHSYVQTLVNQGELTAAQANFHPQSNILMGCLGTDKEPHWTAISSRSLALATPCWPVATVCGTISMTWSWALSCPPCQPVTPVNF